MHSADLINYVVARTGLHKTEAEAVLDSLVRNITAALRRGERVVIRNFGTFSVERSKTLEQEIKEAREQSTEELLQRLSKSPKKPRRTKAASFQYQRNANVIVLVKRRAKGVCELCGNNAPFNDKSDDPYLEVHHIKWLAKGGTDTLGNAVALCPNCHRKMHIVASEADVRCLINKAAAQLVTTCPQASMTSVP